MEEKINLISKEWGMMSESFKFSWRWNRKKFWLYPLWTIFLFSLFLFGILWLLNFSGLPDSSQATIYWISLFLFSISLLTVSIFSYIKRLRDLDINPWMSLLYFIPFANIYLFIICWFFKGTIGENKYGTNPLWNIRLEDKEETAF